MASRLPACINVTLEGQAAPSFVLPNVR